MYIPIYNTYAYCIQHACFSMKISIYTISAIHANVHAIYAESIYANASTYTCHCVHAMLCLPTHASTHCPCSSMLSLSMLSLSMLSLSMLLSVQPCKYLSIISPNTTKYTYPNQMPNTHRWYLSPSLSTSLSPPTNPSRSLSSNTNST